MTSTSKHAFVLVDVFADRALAGNPLAVFPDAEGLSPEAMQALAREMDHAATAFLLPSQKSGAAFRLRIFSRDRPIPFAGHPALGAHFVEYTDPFGNLSTSASWCSRLRADACRPLPGWLSRVRSGSSDGELSVHWTTRSFS